MDETNAHYNGTMLASVTRNVRATLMRSNQVLIAWDINHEHIDSGMPLVNTSLNFFLYEKELAGQKDIDAVEMRHFSTRLRNGELWIFQN